MAEENTKNKNSNHDRSNNNRSTRGPRGLLRRYANVEHCIIEDPFSLRFSHNHHKKAGDGCYVSATVQNRRYYGVLVDQAAFKTASELWFQNEAESLDLNRRMKLLHHQKEERSKNEGVSTLNEEAHERKQPATTTTSVEVTSPAISFQPATTDGDKKRKAEIKTTTASDHKSSELNSTNGPEGSQTTELGDESNHDRKRAKVVNDRDEANSSAHNEQGPPPPSIDFPSRPVQKFKYLPPITTSAAKVSKGTTTSNTTSDDDSRGPGYRVLLATYADVVAAAEDDMSKARTIEDACRSGGGFVGNFYYQYETVHSTLESATSASSHKEDGIRTSMGFETFLRETSLPKWFPLSNLEGGGQKMLSMLSMKRNHNGALVWDDKEVLPDVSLSNNGALHHSGTHVPMEPRSKYRIGIVGGGIAGLSCAQEVLRLCDRETIDVEVVLLEGRSRLGGRLWTDSDSFKVINNDLVASSSLSVDLGAAWIHGIDDNPLAALAREAGTHFMAVSDQVLMLGEAMQVINKNIDERMGKLFDDVLEQAADDCWAAEDNVSVNQRSQKAIRWYANALLQSKVARAASYESGIGTLVPTDVPEHRFSSDITIDHAIGAEIAKRRRGQFAKLTPEEQRVLLWNTKSLESTLGVDINDLSLKFWENDERHTFEGDHVVLKEGYSAVVNHMSETLKRRGDRFKCVLNFDAGKIEYARKSTTQPYADRSGRQRKFIELSDTCCVTSQDESQSLMFDFVVSAVPLGVLKEGLVTNDDSAGNALAFHPPLPFSKADSIKNVGFGLLNKLYLQFPIPFWRGCIAFDEEQATFGNASGINSKYYMFLDVGRSVGSDLNAPAVLMTLLSGRDAVESEQKSDEDILESVMETLRGLFSGLRVPEPIAFRFTRWGSDRFSRGSHSFLPPGATDQDFQILQSPINGNGDSLLLDGSETMRLFFAGEHTTALHPSTAHGALLSGIRAAKEVVNTIKLNFNGDNEVIDRLIPLALFRKLNPEASLHCNMCQLVGTRVREGTLLAFKRGARQVLAHNNCAEYSPEVGVNDGRWMHVIKAVNRGKVMTCTICRKSGATIGCTFHNCFRVYHFSCAEDTGWRFERDGKVFYCDLHRSYDEAEPNECDRVSLSFCRSKVGGVTLRCILCGQGEDSQRHGELLAFQRHKGRVIIHEKCARYTNIVDTSEIESRIDFEFRNVFEAADLAKTCAKCGKNGATIGCAEHQCKAILHFGCAEDSGWNFEKKGPNFKCGKHRGMVRRLRKHDMGDANCDQPKAGGGIFQHALFAPVQDNRKPRPVEKPANADIGGVFPLSRDHPSFSCHNEEESTGSESEESKLSDDDGGGGDAMNLPVSAPVIKPNVTPSITDLTRHSLGAAWNICLNVVRPSTQGPCVVALEATEFDASVKRLILSLNGVPIGLRELMTVQDIVALLRKETSLKVEFIEED